MVSPKVLTIDGFKKPLIGLKLFLCFNGIAIAQNKIKLDDWVTLQKNSLNHIGVDTIVFYHHYCGEYSVTVDEDEPTQCDVIDNSWKFIDGVTFINKSALFII